MYVVNERGTDAGPMWTSIVQGNIHFIAAVDHHGERASSFVRLYETCSQSLMLTLNSLPRQANLVFMDVVGYVVRDVVHIQGSLRLQRL
jgi:hypothetical protein